MMKSIMLLTQHTWQFATHPIVCKVPSHCLADPNLIAKCLIRRHQEPFNWKTMPFVHVLPPSSEEFVPTCVCLLPGLVHGSAKAIQRHLQPG